MQKVSLKSIGCRTNQEEMSALKNRLVNQDGYEFVQSSDDADIIILNTCSVTGNTESKTKRLISSLSRKNPKAKILLTGCLAQQSPEELLKSPGVEWVVGNSRKSEIPEILNSSDEGVFYSLFDDEKELMVADFAAKPADPSLAGRTRFSLKIQEGCDFSCGYCIVPQLRGPSRSVSRDKVIENCRNALVAGYKEVVITGTHIGQYKGGNGYLFADLIEDLLKLDNNFRIRLSSLDPREFSDKLLSLLLKEKRICDHLHISIQSFSPNVLDSMNRIYSDRAEFLERLKEYKKVNENAGLGGDFIVGYPGESDADFLQTVKFVTELEFNYGHVFRYSKRPGTAADKIKDQVPENIKKERSDKLRKVLSTNRENFIYKQINTKSKIIVEATNPVKGITSNYIRIVAENSQIEKNSWSTILLTDFKANENYCSAEIIR